MAKEMAKFSVKARALVAECKQIEGGNDRIVWITFQDGETKQLPNVSNMWDTLALAIDANEIAKIEVTKAGTTVFVRELDAVAAATASVKAAAVGAKQQRGKTAEPKEQPEREASLIWQQEPITLSADQAPDMIRNVQLLDALHHRATLRMAGVQQMFMREVGGIWNETMGRLGDVVDTQGSTMDRLFSMIDDLRSENAELRATIAELSEQLRTVSTPAAKDDDDDDSLIPASLRKGIIDKIGQKLEGLGEKVEEKIKGDKKAAADPASA